MVQMLFFIRFRNQLKKIRPNLVEALENDVAASIYAAGGSVEAGRKMLAASFDENRIGFWLNMVIFLERVQGTLEKARPELYGYSLTLGRNVADGSADRLPFEDDGIWCSGEIRKALEFYIEFYPSRETGETGISGDFSLLRSSRSFDRELPFRREYPFREKITRSLARNNDRNTLLLGEAFLGKRDGIYHYCAEAAGDIPPLVVRFGAGGRGLICFADAWTPVIRSFAGDVLPKEDWSRTIAELDALQSRLFGERLSEEWSFGMRELCRDFIRSLLTVYGAAAKTRSSRGIVVLERLSLSGGGAAALFREVYTSLDEKSLLLGEDDFAGESRESWDRLFPRILKFPPENFSPVFDTKGLKTFPGDLWELAYIIFLLGRYFPAALLPRLFEEEGLGRDLYHRAVQTLSAMGLLLNDDPRPELPDFESRAQRALGNRKETIRSAVRKRILAWADSGRIRPCFRLLKILSELGEAPETALALRALKADVLNGTWEDIGETIDKKSFTALVGAGNAPALRYIFKTLRALVWRGSGEIEAAFREPLPALSFDDGKSCYPGCRAQLEINLAAFYTGSGNTDAASEAVRKAMLLNKILGKDAIPAYRLFSLVNLSRQRIGDALEYISFALEQAEKNGQREELLLTRYFAASINLLYGNLSGAARLALKAEETAAALGQADWRMRAGFLRGRLCFESGRYGDALDIFRALAAEAADVPPETGRETAAMTATINAWIFRTENFLALSSPGWNGMTRGTPVPSGLDAGLFAIEAACLAGEYEKTVSLAEGFLTSDDEGQGDFHFTEQPDWRSGFYQCEYMYQPEKAPGTRVAMVYRTLALSALHPSRETRTEILGRMQRFMREELLPDTDPRDSFYFHAWYRMLQDSQNPNDISETHVDMNTVVSMAYKRLQRRAGRIDDAETRQAFLSLPHWNKALCLAAREYKVI